jgi:dihydroxyacetone kinase-like protein
MLITTDEYMNYINLVAEKIRENKEYITELDSITGDGDHWVNINMGFQKLVDEDESLRKLSLGELFKKIGMVIMSTVGGSSGVLYGSAYLEGFKIIGDADEMDVYLLSKVLDGKLNAIMKRGNAKPGYKTMIDTLYEGTKMMKESIEMESTEVEILKALKDGARIGMENTKNMEAVRGRACYQADKGIGHLDPGAVTMYYQLEVLVDYFTKLIVE